MNDKKKEAALEAILFAMGDSVELKKLADAVGETPEKTQELLERMRERWDKEGRGVTLISLEGAWQMCTRAEYYDCLIRICLLYTSFLRQNEANRYERMVRGKT